MIYKFRSAADGDIVMLQGPAERVLALLGKDPSPKGIIEPAAMPAAIAALQAAIAADETPAPDDDAQSPEEGPGAAIAADPVPLRRRAWPLLEMLRRSLAEDVPVVWGV